MVELTAERRAFAGKIASCWVRKLPRSVNSDNIRQAALIGLWDGLRRDPNANDWYLRARINGAIIEELREHDWLKRSARRAGASWTMVHYEHDGELERMLGEGGATPSPEAEIMQREVVEQALSARMHPRNRAIIEQYFFGERRQIDIAKSFGVTEAAIHQRRATALEAMRCTVTA